MIGINSQILSPSGASAGVGFAIPVNIAKRIVPQLVQNGEVRRPKLGISTRDVESLANQVRMPVSEGLLIMEVQQGGAAVQQAAAGLLMEKELESEDGNYSSSFDVSSLPSGLYMLILRTENGIASARFVKQQ